jgi:tRNA pseudouridine38-40 synthase
MQVVGVRAPADWAPDALAAALNERLPEGVGVACAHVAKAGFHPQYTNEGKTYRYRMQLEGTLAPAWEGLAWQPSVEHGRIYGRQIDPTRLAELLRRCEGTRDFFAFHASSSVRKPRTLTRTGLQSLGGGLFEAVFEGAGFARYQVRILVGACVAVAAGALEKAALDAALERAETLAGIKAPGKGLILWEVRYPKAVDPFAEERETAAGVPSVPPFTRSM